MNMTFRAQNVQTVPVHWSIYIHRGLSQFSSLLFRSAGKTSLGLSQDFNSGMPYSRPARYQLSYAIPYWATLHPTEQRCTLLSNAAPYWATLHPNWATLHPTELHCTLLSYATACWTRLHSTELRCNLLNCAAPYRDTLHSAELRCTLQYWATLHLTELSCTLLS